MPKERYEDIKDFEGVKLVWGDDAGMYEYYQRNAQWQEAEYENKQARSNNKLIKSRIDFKMSKK